MTPKRTIFEVFLDGECYVRDTLDLDIVAHLELYLPSLVLHQKTLTDMIYGLEQGPVTYNIQRDEVLQLARYYLPHVRNDGNQIFACLMLMYKCPQNAYNLTITVRNVFDDEEEAK